MSSTINAATSGGLISTGDTSGQLQLQTAGTTALSISSGQYVTLANGISNGLNVSGAGWGVLPYTANSTVIDNNSGQTRIFATGANTSTYGTLLSYAGTTNGSATLVTTVGKDLTFALQGATQSSGTGIAFPASQSASTDANTLDDYEKGTWTPTVANFTVSGTTTTSGTYTKIGRVVYFDLSFANTGTIAYGTSCLITLPFAGIELSGMVAMYVESSSENQISGKSGVQVYLNTSSTRFFVGSFTTTSAGQTLRFGGFYRVS